MAECLCKSNPSVPIELLNPIIHACEQGYELHMVSRSICRCGMLECVPCVQIKYQGMSYKLHEFTIFKCTALLYMILVIISIYTY